MTLEPALGINQHQGGRLSGPGLSEGRGKFCAAHGRPFGTAHSWLGMWQPQPGEAMTERPSSMSDCEAGARFRKPPFAWAVRVNADVTPAKGS